MSQYKIEKRTKYATDGSIISTVWDVYHEDGRVAESDLVSEEKAQEMVEAYETMDVLSELKLPPHHKSDSKP
ncbi:hypothetical protein NK678_004655 [Salmonella enterica]|nr:hypothetical protein [Salmonella enterica]EDV6136307.1 hypothetical protein [Salmonella enterica subsp. enterica]QVA24644.1 hypothetical protein JYM84_04640 [Salmonella enterica subsp. enterica serovar Rubislaw]WPM84276.1 hypothetical protein QNH14_15300 [Enterobacteriaceae bacterium CA-0114]EEG1308978.1 hypothetical protein [Salmonella enterica]